MPRPPPPQVDPRDPARAFQFAVQVVSDDKYAGAPCSLCCNPGALSYPAPAVGATEGGSGGVRLGRRCKRCANGAPLAHQTAELVPCRADQSDAMPAPPSLHPAVQSCEPAVAGMQALLVQLNAGGSFSAFVRCMRREFQALVAAEQAGQVAAGAGEPPEPLAAC